jgi:N-acetylglucosaminyldiphosphoundecaprenol N-acetyl-beta-D-mannosaminyltransferase
LIDLGKHNILGIQIDATDYEATVSKIINAAKNHQAMAVSAIAVHGIMTGVLNRNQKCRLNHFDLLVPDGQPVRWALNIVYKTHLQDRVYGPTLMLNVCEKATKEGLSIFFYGSRPEVISALIANLQVKFPKITIAGCQPSLFRIIDRNEKAIIVQNILESKANIVFVGLGCPRQEVWVYEYRDQLPLPLIAVGAAFDFHAKLLSQAPHWMQTLGLEWLFRLVHEPRRLWKRYLILNPLYLILLVLQVLGLKRYDPTDATIPNGDINFG